MKKKILAIVLCLAMGMGLAACGSSSSSESGSGSASDGTTASDSTGEATDNTIVLAMGGGFDTVDPGHMYEKNPQLIVNACYETLFKFYSNDGEPEPNLADEYSFSDDNKTLTVTLKDATFASGNPVTSADVAFSINRCKNLKDNPAFIADTIESIETPDDKTVVFHLTQADSGILAKLTYSSMSVLDSEVVKANGGTDAEDASTADTAQTYLNSTSAGSGMYIMTEFTIDEEVVLEKNPNYWGDNATNVDKYIIKIQSDANTQMMSLAQGDYDVALNLTDDTIAELEGNESVTAVNKATKTIGFVMMNMDESIGGPVANSDVQKAIRKALDYEGIKTICGEGTVTPYSLIQEGFLGSKGEREADYQNIEEAKQLLADAGYADGFDIDLTVCSDLDMEGVSLTDLAQKVKSDLAEININVNVVTEAWAGGYGDDYRDGKLAFTVMYWGVDYNDPNVQLAFLPGQTVGLRAGWTEEMDPEIAAYNEKVMNATETSEREQALAELQDATYEDGPFILIAQAPSHVAYNNRLDGVEDAVSDVYTLDLTLINVK